MDLGDGCRKWVINVIENGQWFWVVVWLWIFGSNKKLNTWITKWKLNLTIPTKVYHCRQHIKHNRLKARAFIHSIDGYTCCIVPGVGLLSGAHSKPLSFLLYCGIGVIECGDRGVTAGEAIVELVVVVVLVFFISRWALAVFFVCCICQTSATPKIERQKKKPMPNVKW